MRVAPEQDPLGRAGFELLDTDRDDRPGGPLDGQPGVFAVVVVRQEQPAGREIG